MRRSASEILRNLESRIAKLENSYGCENNYRTKGKIESQTQYEMCKDINSIYHENMDISKFNKIKVEEEAISEQYGELVMIVSVDDRYYAIVYGEGTDQEIRKGVWDRYDFKRGTVTHYYQRVVQKQ